MSKPSLGRRLTTLAAAFSAAGGLAFATGGTALAANQDGRLEANEFGLYYSAGRTGCVHDSFTDDRTLDNNEFKGSCTGRGDEVEDNTESYWNRSLLQWCVYTNTDWGGSYGALPAGHIGNASSTFKNKISSHHWGRCGS
ncbi:MULTISPECIES: peptidase inhibitor family I36 protein [unclassified Streptomyces]|uniref:peptidase inhibitor family I36 protein n=1 Tax=unclassified Streptomyces TaxID=2593676 RepID=UPI003665871E